MKFSKINPGADVQAYGTEPSWTNQDEIGNLKIAEIRALNWYNYFVTTSKRKRLLSNTWLALVDQKKKFL